MVRSTETIYNGTKPCANCGEPQDPRAVLFNGPTGMCHNCRNEAQRKNIKSGMAGPLAMRNQDLIRGNGY